MNSEKKVRVLHLRSSGGKYGAESVILNLARELDQVGCANHIVCLNNSKNPHVELIDEAAAAGIKATFINCRGRFDARAIKSIRRIILEQNISIIHTHDYKAAVFGLLASIGLKVRRVVTNHGWTKVNFKLYIYQFIEGVVYNFFDRIVIVSDVIKKRIAPFVFDKKKIVVIENGINTKRIKDKGLRIKEEENLIPATSSFNPQPSSHVIGIVGRLSVEKGHVYLLKALAKLLEEIQGHKDTRTQVKTQGHKDTRTHEIAQPVSCDVCHASIKSLRLLIVGDGPLESELKRLCGEFGLSFSDYRESFDQSSIFDSPFSVLFAGVQKDMSAVYSALDVLVMPSLEEGLPMTLLEAMVAGVPVIATPVGGIPKVIKDDETGFLVDVGDVEGLVDAIERIIYLRARELESPRARENSGERRGMGTGMLDKILANARQLVHEKYSTRLMSEKYMESYK